MTRFSSLARWLRRGEIALWALGLSLGGWALASTLTAKAYQARQDQAYFSPEPQRDPGARAAADPLVLGRIEIPRIGVAAIVREGDDDTTLAIAVGHIAGTARPGERGNMALAGHRDSFFRGLRDIRRQDTIRIVTQKDIFEYTVDSTEVVNPEEIRVLDPTRDTVLTLVTCFPFGFVGPAPNRFIVRASLTPSLPAGAGGEGAL